MKYGILIMNYGSSAIRSAGYNLGDPIQCYVVRQLYKRMGISQDQIKEIELHELNTYNDEYVILPMIAVALGLGNPNPEIPLSERIIPLFISTHIAVTELTNIQIEYLKRYAPIGCRDEYSLNIMRKYGIPAYLSGCITILHERTIPKCGKKIYCIDTPKELDPYIPDDLKKNVIYDTHLIPIPSREMTKDEALEYHNKSIQRLQIYEENAALVISSRLHALVPCMAMGIPVIGVFENISYRFSWLDKYIKLYMIDEVSNIDWNPQPVNLETTKNILFSIFSQKLQDTYNKYAEISDISYFYENRTKALYGNRYHTLLQSIQRKQNEPFSYIIWGCGLIGNNVYTEMQKLYPNAKLEVAIDGYKTGTWHEVEIKKADALKEYADRFIIIAAYSAREEAYATLHELNKEEGKDFIYVGTMNG